MDTSIKSTEKIKTRQDFVIFLNELLADFQTNKNNWENKDLGSFLEALSRYAEDIDGFYINTGQDVDADKASWKVIADMFMGARIYE
jgi:hypothetical protein